MPTRNPQNKPPQGQMPMQHRAAPITAVNADERTIDIVWTTGASVRRYDWRRDEQFDEVLVVEARSCDLSRLNAGAPFLRDHAAWNLNAVLGVIERAWIEAGKGFAKVRFPAAEDDPDADRVFRKMVAGIIRNVSVGYMIRKVERVAKEGAVTQWRVVDWQPYEISAVPVGADPGAGLRADESAETFPFTLVERAAPEPAQENIMDPEEENGAPAAANTRNQPAPAPTPAPSPAPQPAAEQRSTPEGYAWPAADMARVQARAAAFGLSADDALAVMAETRGIEAATDALQARAAARNAPRQTPQAQIVRDEGDTVRSAIENAILHRANPSSVQLDDSARAWRGMSLLEIGRTFIEDTQNVRLRGFDKRDLAMVLLGQGDQRAGMHSTSDFANILANIASKRLRDGYGTARQTWRPFCRQSNAPDFKERSIVMLNGLPELKPIKEGGEYTFAKFSDSVEKYALGTFGRKIAITRQTLINDDLGAFDRLPTLFGRAAAEFESDTVWGILINNPNMGDGVALFHANHGNLAGAGAAPSESTLEAMEIAMGAQVDAAGKPLNLPIKFVAVSRKHKVATQKLLQGITAAKSGDVNVYANSFDLIIEDRLYNAGGASMWFGIADPAQWDTIEYAYLEGEEGLYTEQRIGFDVDGIEIKGRLDFAAKAIDFKGFQKNPGN